MDTTIRNIDAGAYRELKARASLEGKTIGEALSDAIRVYVARPHPTAKTARLATLVVPEAYPPGNENLSVAIDHIVYGI